MIILFICQRSLTLLSNLLIPFLIITLSTLWILTQIPATTAGKVENVSVGGVIWIFPLPPLAFSYGKFTPMNTLLLIAYILCIILAIIFIIYLIKYIRSR